MMSHAPSLRTRLLIGASLGSMLLAGVAEAQNGRISGGRSAGVDPAAAAARAAQTEALRQGDANAATRRALENFTRAAATRQAMTDAQTAARAAAFAVQSNVPNGLGQGGLQVGSGVTLDPSLWVGANGPRQTVGADGRTLVTVDQTRDKAILTWDSFNVGRETDLVFVQDASNWVVLNRVTDVSADPTRILGNIKANGSVFIINRNGVIFGGSSQVNVRNLVASTADISNIQFMERGIHSSVVIPPEFWLPPITMPAFTDAGGDVMVEAGARIQTIAPATVVEGGGYVMLMGKTVENRGTIVTNRGQTILSAGDNFLVRAGYGTLANQASTTRGQEIAVTLAADSTSGRVVNTGVIEAREGDITLAGGTVVQGGVAVATTSVNTRGTIHLLTDLSDATSSVTLTGNSLTLILPELDSKTTATNAQRDALIAESLNATGRPSLLNNQGIGRLSYLQPDRKDLSRVEISTGGEAIFEGGSQTIAQGGQIAVVAMKRTTIDSGALLDVSGVQDVMMDMASNNLKVNVRPFDMRDSALNREGDGIRSTDVWIDVRDLVLMPSGTGGHVGDRYYTPGGLLEVGGHLGNTAHGIGEWTSVGGTININSAEIVIKDGAVLDISGGSMRYAGGYMQSTRMMGSDGRMYDIGQAPAGVKMLSIGDAFVRNHDRWGEAYSEVYGRPLFSGGRSARWEDGYTVGRDAGVITLSAPTVLMQGQIMADVIVGERQTNARPQTSPTLNENGVVNGMPNRLDGYGLPQNVSPLAGGLYIGAGLAQNYSPATQTVTPFNNEVVIGDAATVAGGVKQNQVLISADTLNDAGLGALRIVGGKIAVENDVTLANGGQLAFSATEIAVNADLTARSGSISLAAVQPCSAGCATVTDLSVGDGVRLDTRGLWVNLATGGDRADMAHLDGGAIMLDSRQGDLRLGKGSVIDASAGGAIREDGGFVSANGGDVGLGVGFLNRENANEMVLDGDIRSYASGDGKGGRLTLSAAGRPITIGEAVLGGGDVLKAGQPLPMDLQLTADLVLPAGWELPFDYSYVVDRVGPGEAFGANTVVEMYDLTIGADWTVPPGVVVYDADFAIEFSEGTVIPAGMALGMIVGEFSEGYVVPADAFPKGVAITPQSFNYAKGDVLQNDLKLSAGQTLSAGLTLPVDAHVAKPLHLDADFFQAGFSNYDIRSGGDLQVRGVIDVAAPVRRYTTASASVASGAAPEAAMELWLPEMFREEAVKGQFIQRQGAGLTLTANGVGPRNWTNPFGGVVSDPLSLGRLTFGAGSVIRVDDGQSVNLNAAQSILMDGRIEARGGSVSLTAGPKENTNRDFAGYVIHYDATRAIWLGENSVIDVSGRANAALDARGLRYANVSKGGSITLGGETAAYVVVRPGAVLDASGAAAEIDYLSTTLPATRNTLKLTTDGGSIAFQSQYGVFLDGDMRAHAGGAGASSGLLSVTLNTPYLPALGSPGREVPDYIRQLRSIYLEETHEASLHADIRFGDCITGCWTPGQTTAEAELSNEGVANIVGQARLGVDQIKKGGFGSLALATDDVILLNGAIDLSLSRNLTLTGSIANLDADVDARLSAAYVRLAGAGRMLGNELVQRDTGALALFKRPDIGGGELTITGGLVDIGSAQFGVNGSVGLSGGRERDYEYAAPKVVNIVSRSDIRMTGGDLNALSNLSLTAAQIYPLTNATAGIYAGKFGYRIPGSTSIWTTLMEGGTVSFHKLDGVTPSAPLSIYGSLIVGADIINQGGVLRAPLGSIQLGVGGYAFVPGPEKLEPGQYGWSDVALTTSEINLLNGSLTSVSGRDLVIPFGGTTDGLTWLLNGVEKTTTNLLQGVTVLGSLRADEGSVLDLSGGGTPSGGAFTNGRGGSVDILTTALANVSPAFQGLSHADNKVYAIVPDYKGSATPTALTGHAQPGVGQQIVIPEGVPGLAAGTYMLLPAEFALMEGAFRVELGSTLRAGAGALNTLADGSVHLGVTTTFANTTVQNALPVEAILTSSKTVRTYSQYNETSFGDFLIAAPAKAQFDNPLPLLPQDGKAFILALTPPVGDSDRPAFSFKGKGLFDAAKGGIGGSLAVIGGNPYGMETLTLEILGAGGVATPDAMSLYAADLNAVGAKVMTIGGMAQRSPGTAIDDILILAGGGLPNAGAFSYGFGEVAVRKGAELIAPQVLLITSNEGSILVEDGARISTVGKGDPAFSSAMGFTLRADYINLLSVSNGLLEYTSTAGASGSGSVTVEDGASIYTDGTLSFVSPGAVRLGENVNYGARYLGFSTGSVNLGTTQALADAAAQGILPGGIVLNQTVLDRLMRGDAASGAPRLERLMLSANQSINFYGSISLDTRDAVTGKSSLQLVLNTPALYGHGTANDVARITTGTLVWNGLVGNQGSPTDPIPAVALPGAVIANGPGTGLGKLDLVAERIVLGYQDGVRIDATMPLNRLALGFSSVNLTASDRIEANHYGDLAVYQSQAVFGQAGQGGVLNLNTPLLTGQAGSRLHYKAGDAINVRRPEGLAASTGKVEAALGAEIRLTAGSVLADTTIALPSGKLVMTATTGDIQILDGARLDLAGRDTKFFDETRYSWGGDVELESTHGSVQQTAGSTIDISADYNHAGLLKVTALQGAVALNGTIDGRARHGDRPADPTMRNGSIDVRAGTLTDFAGLNRRLTENGVTESRSFVIKTGDLTIGDEVQARHVSISADGGDLTVTGRINASGYRPGSIRLSARDDLTLTSTAVLDASGKTLVVDSYGAPIDASNRATVELTSASGLLTLASGSTLDLSAADGVKRGQVELNAHRVGGADVAIDARGPLTIKGVSSLSVNGFRSYQPAGGVIDQALMDGVHADSTAFINAAIGNAALLDRMSGLTAYADAFHLRPGVELRSAPGESLRVSGDLNMAGYRYASLNAATPLTQVYGSGEAGVLLIRAADKLDIYGSITDGFAEPARTPDDNGWVLYPGRQGVNSEWLADHQLSSPLKLSEGAQFPMGVSLTFDAPVRGFSVNRNTLIGAEVQLADTYTLPQDWVATSAIRLPDGSTIAKGAIMMAGMDLPAGSTLEAGAVLPMSVALQATTWPKGTPLPARMTLSTSTQLQVGDILPRDSTIAIDGLFGVIREPTVLTSPYTLVGDPTLPGVSSIPGGAASTAVLSFEVTVRSGTALRRDSGVIPFGFETNSTMSSPTGGWVVAAPIWASKAAFASGAAPIWTPGQRVTTTLAAGVWFGAGAVLPRQSAGTAGALSIRATVVPAGTPFNLFNSANVFLNANVVAPAGAVIPVGVNMQPVGGIMQNTRPIQADGTQGRIWAVAPMLERGSQSWSMRLIAGADLGSADGRAVRAVSELAEAGQTGNLTLSDRHFFNPQATTQSGLLAAQVTALKQMQNFSVIRTGIGSLDLLAGGSYEQLSLYGVYTAGAPSEDIGGLTLDGYNVFNQPRAILAGGANLANPWIGQNFDGYAASIQDYRAWYPENGGDVLLAVQGRMVGYTTGRSGGDQRVGSGAVGNWLWRQGGYGVSEGRTPQMGEDMPTAWWINFGGYVPNNASSMTTSAYFNAPLLEGFMGIGALGGGNLTVRSGGDAGVVGDWSRDGSTFPDSNRAAIASTGLNFAVGGTGRVTSVNRTSGVVTDGTLVQTGGGDINILIGGRLNGGADMLGEDLGGSVVSLRGDVNLIAGEVGRMYYATNQISLDPRKPDLISTVIQKSVGGLTVVIGDGDVRLDTRGDLVLTGVGDPGSTPGSVAGASLGYLNDQGVFVRPDGFMMGSSFSLWRDDTSVNLFSAGGNITPMTLADGNAKPRDGRYWYPPILNVTSASGDIFWDGERCDDYTCNLTPLELAPSPKGQIQFLAKRAIAAGGYRTADGQGAYSAGLPVAMSGMSNGLDLLPNPFRPTFVTAFQRTPQASINTPTPFGGNNPNAIGSLLSFQDDNATGTLLQGRKPPALFYAATGDISNLNLGFITYDAQNTYYVNSGAAKIRAGRDIVNLGTGPAIGCGLYGAIDCRSEMSIPGVFGAGGLVIHNDPSDITLVSAGRDIIYANMTVAGPGNLVVEAGRNIYQSDKGRFTSVGPLFNLSPSTRNGGAGISVMTGVGAGGAQYDAFNALYLDPANKAEAGRPLADQPGKVFKTYEVELAKWLSDRFGYTAADGADALSYFGKLDEGQRAVFARLVYFDELKAGGREYNNEDSSRFGSYLRGRNAIAVLFPEKDAQGHDISYDGDLTMVGGSAIRTLFGGNIEVLVAGGQAIVGVGGKIPPSTAGILSMGSGDIDIYAQGSVLLGQSRVFTTFGGDLFMWSATGDINAGRGSTSTAVYQSPRRVYDNLGNVTLSPPTQNTGAGIATLAPIPEIPAGDIDLIAPLGTIDAGEAGIRVSGDVNLAALQVLNAANIEVKGSAVGIPVVAAVNTSALTAASNATSTVAAEATRLAERARPITRDMPAIITSRFLGFGEG